MVLGLKVCKVLHKVHFPAAALLNEEPPSQTCDSSPHVLCSLCSASDVFSSCYRSDESRSFTLLIRKSPVWGGTTCLQMGMGADARLFFSHDGVQVCHCLRTAVTDSDSSLLYFTLPQGLNTGPSAASEASKEHAFYFIFGFFQTHSFCVLCSIAGIRDDAED